MPSATCTPFTLRMYELCELAKKRVYWPGDFYRAIEETGDDFAPRAKRFLREGLQSGFLKLAKADALDLCMEWCIAYEDWSEFSDEDRELAHQRLVLMANMFGLRQPPPLPVRT